jgi:hypothetical protein
MTGCDGGVVLGEAMKLSASGTFTVRVPVAVPPGPEAVRANTVVALKATIEDPEVGKGPASSFCVTDGVIVTDVAFVVAHVIVVV